MKTKYSAIFITLGSDSYFIQVTTLTSYVHAKPFKRVFSSAYLALFEE